MTLHSVLDYAHQLVAQTTCESDIAIDATVGNGNDTLFLAQLVGTQGKIYGCDIQQQALQQAEDTLIQELDDVSHIQLFQESHADLLSFIPKQHHGQVASIMFNLGYLPGADHNLVTKAETTVLALEASLHLLRKSGLITVIIYSGHPGGQEESQQVQEWANQLPQRKYEALHYQFINQKNHPPFLIAISKL